MAISRMRVLVVSAAVAGLAAAALSASAAAHAATCPAVDQTTGAVTPPPAPGVDWSGCNLTNAALQNADLAGANLSSANLASALLSGANLHGANLSSALATGTDLTGADLSAATVSATFENADLAGVNVQGTDLGNAIMINVSSGGITGQPLALPFQFELLKGYLIGQNANLTMADLSGVNLSGDRLDSVNLTRANLTSANLSGAVLTNGDLLGVNLTSADLTNAALSGVDLSEAKLNGATMTGADLALASSGGVTGTPAALPAHWMIVNGYLIGPAAALGHAALGNADLTGADLAGAVLGFAIFTNSNLTNADLSNASMQFATFNKTNLTGADLSGANVNSATWSQATCPDRTVSEQHVPDGCTTPLDVQPPAAAPTVAVGSPGADGWYHSVLTVAWNWADDGTIDQPKCDQASVTSGQGSAVTVTASCSDMNGNTGHASDQFKIDTTAPKVSVNGVTNGHQYVVGQPVAPGCATTDGLSGAGSLASLQVSSHAIHGIGSFTASCTGGTDVAGNKQAAPVTATYRVVAGFGGFLSPRQGATLAKSARTIAITFRLTDTAGKPIPAGTASALGIAHAVRASLTGPGISKKTAVCAWSATAKLFRCAISTPGSVRTGTSNNYSITALEDLNGSLIRAPVTGKARNPETIHFR
jgi:uncharacterized protein YjbI with pentapeptide repeats